MIKLKLGGKYGVGRYAVVDDDVYYRIRHLEWTVRYKDGQLLCVVAWTDVNGRRSQLRLHRYVMDCYDRKSYVDHVNGDILDNRRDNLRVCTMTQNNRNRGGHKRSRSPHKGVVWDAPKKMWRAQISVDGRRKFLGYFDVEDEAAHNYDWWAIRVHEEFARLNFPAHDYASFIPKVMPAGDSF